MTVIVSGPPSQSVLGNLSPLYHAYPDVRLLFSLHFGYLSFFSLINDPEYMMQEMHRV